MKGKELAKLSQGFCPANATPTIVAGPTSYREGPDSSHPGAFLKPCAFLEMGKSQSVLHANHPAWILLYLARLETLSSSGSSPMRSRRFLS